MTAIIQEEEFQHILRILNTNVDGRKPVIYALTGIKGIGRRFSSVICKKAQIDLRIRAGELSAKQIEMLKTIMQNPRQFSIPDYMLNRQRDFLTEKMKHLLAQQIDATLREDLERMKKNRRHRGLRQGIKCRGQRTKRGGSGKMSHRR